MNLTDCFVLSMLVINVFVKSSSSQLVHPTFSWFDVYGDDSANSSNASSCQTRCGSEASRFPCSCQPECLVYQSCCGDFSEFCSENWIRGMDKLGALFDRSVRCTMEGYFMVSSCPAGKNDGRIDYENTLPPRIEETTDPYGERSSEYFLEPVISPKETVNLQTILNQRPVYDNYTGILFKNYDKYQCNALPNSSPVLWEVKLSVESSTIVDDRIILESEFEWNSVWYQPPNSSLTTLIKPNCIPQSIQGCPYTTKFTAPTLYENCRNHIEYIQSENGFIYNNEDCKECSTKGRTTHKFVEESVSPTHSSTGLSIIMSFSGADTLVLKRLDTKPSPDLKWKQMSCVLNSEGKSFTTTDRCDNPVCVDTAIRTTTDRCVDGFYVHLAHGRAGLPMERFYKDRMRDVLTCWLASDVDYDIIDEKDGSRPFPVEYDDHTLQDIMYVNKIAVSSQEGRNRLGLGRPDYIRRLDHLNKAFIWYQIEQHYIETVEGNLEQRMDRVRQALGRHYPFGLTPVYYGDAGNLTTGRGPSPFVRIHTAHNSTLLLQNENPDLFNAAFPPDKVVVDKNITYTTCFCEHNRTETCVLVCWQTPLFEDDQRYISNQVSSHCFQDLRGASASSIIVVEGGFFIVLAVGIAILRLQMT